MGKKVILTLVDGMRPDGMLACSHPFVQKLISLSAADLSAQTVYPSVTLPCHVSLFHSVTPDRHGTLTNTFVPMARPVEGLVERLDAAGKQCAMFYTWEELRDLVLPGHMYRSFCCNVDRIDGSDAEVTDVALKYLKTDPLDFIFLYLGYTDHAGHDYGWMGEEYMAAIRGAFDCIERVHAALDEDTTLIVTADHGGHGRNHGENVPEDMTIPILCCGRDFAPGSKLQGASILDIAPTITDLLGAAPAREWEGHSLLGAAKR